MKNSSPLQRASKPKPLIATMHRWKFSALAAAAVATVGLHTPDALALSLGPITVQSALGEPLRAEITLPQVTPAEADSLRVTPASPEVFRAQGMEYSPAVTKVQIKFMRRTDGQAVLRVTSDRAITDPRVVFARQVWRTDAPEAALSLIKAGLGWGWLPRSFVRAALSEGTLRERVEDAAAIFPKDELVQDVVKFIFEAKDYPLTLPRNGHGEL